MGQNFHICLLTVRAEVADPPLPYNPLHFKSNHMYLSSPQKSHISSISLVLKKAKEAGYHTLLNNVGDDFTQFTKNKSHRLTFVTAIPC